MKIYIVGFSSLCFAILGGIHFILADSLLEVDSGRPVRSILVNRDPSFVAIGSDSVGFRSNIAVFWPGKTRPTRLSGERAVYAMVFHQGSRTLYAAGEFGYIESFRLPTGNRLRPISFPDVEILALTKAGTDKLIIAGHNTHSNQPYLGLYSIRQKKVSNSVLFAETRGQAFVSDVHYHEKSKLLLVMLQRRMYVYELPDFDRKYDRQLRGTVIRQAVFSKDGGTIIWGGLFGELGAIQIAASGSSLVKAAHEGEILGLAESDDGLLVTSGDDKQVKVWSSYSGGLALVGTWQSPTVVTEIVAEAGRLYLGMADGNLEVLAMEDFMK